jgi:pyruvate,water dikinase
MTAAPLTERLDPLEFGGKAACLAAAIRAGLPVPTGIALSADLVADVADGDPAAVAQVERLSSVLERPLAVRSSAVGEDSREASFAGQHLTRLNVRTSAELIEAVSAVRRSSRAESALAYRARLGLRGDPATGAVVQELVDCDCAGVLFTQNPLDGADELVIEASWGLGEAVVAGLVTPDRFRLGRDGSVLEERVGFKDVVVRISPRGGTNEEPIPDSLARSPCLVREQLRALHELALGCEAAFGGAQDIEWGYEGGTLYLLQSRPVTGRS